MSNNTAVQLMYSHSDRSKRPAQFMISSTVQWRACALVTASADPAAALDWTVAARREPGNFFTSQTQESLPTSAMCCSCEGATAARSEQTEAHCALRLRCAAHLRVGVGDHARSNCVSSSCCAEPQSDGVAVGSGRTCWVWTPRRTSRSWCCRPASRRRGTTASGSAARDHDHSSRSSSWQRMVHQQNATCGPQIRRLA